MVCCDAAVPCSGAAQLTPHSGGWSLSSSFFMSSSCLRPPLSPLVLATAIALVLALALVFALALAHALALGIVAITVRPAPEASMLCFLNLLCKKAKEFAGDSVPVAFGTRVMDCKGTAACLVSLCGWLILTKQVVCKVPSA